jgi:hypothetical protein
MITAGGDKTTALELGIRCAQRDRGEMRQVEGVLSRIEESSQ